MQIYKHGCGHNNRTVFSPSGWLTKVVQRQNNLLCMYVSIVPSYCMTKIESHKCGILHSDMFLNYTWCSYCACSLGTGVRKFQALGYRGDNICMCHLICSTWLLQFFPYLRPLSAECRITVTNTGHSRIVGHQYGKRFVTLLMPKIWWWLPFIPI